jgi:hypothetical protein
MLALLTATFTLLAIGARADTIEFGTPRHVTSSFYELASDGELVNYDAQIYAADSFNTDADAVPPVPPVSEGEYGAVEVTPGYAEDDVWSEESLEAMADECSSGSSCYCNDCCCCEPQDSLGLGGCFRSTPGGFDRFVSPMTNPVFFEDPRTLTEARLIFLNHKVPTAAGGGDIQLYALQIRAAITDRLSLIATKDGYAVSSNPLIRDGWADIAAGLKYTLFSDVCNQRLLSVGAAYEMPTGSTRTLQGNGNGEFHVFASGGTQLGCRGHWLSASGFRLPADVGDESQSWYWSNHFDYEVCRGWYAVTEVNWYQWLQAGNGGIANVEGGDLFNFGSTGVGGQNIVTGAFGAKFKPSPMSEIGVAWELPLTDRRDVLENRLTIDVIRRF